MAASLPVFKRFVERWKAMRFRHRTVDLSSVPSEALIVELARRGRTVAPVPGPGQVEIPESEFWGHIGELSRLAGVVLPEAVGELRKANATSRELRGRLGVCESLLGCAFEEYVASGLDTFTEYLESE